MKITALKCTVLGDNIVGRPQGQRSPQHPLTGGSLEPGAKDKHSDANTEISSACQMLAMPSKNLWAIVSVQILNQHGDSGLALCQLHHGAQFRL